MTTVAAAWAGSVQGWALLAVALLAAWRVTRGGAGSAVSELSKANEVLTRRNHELGGEVRDLRVELAEVSARTDFAAALVEHENRTIVQARVMLAEHEKRAVERHDGLLVVLNMIASRLGPEPNGHDEKVAA